MGSEPDTRDRAAEVEAPLARLHRRLGIEGPTALAAVAAIAPVG